MVRAYLPIKLMDITVKSFPDKKFLFFVVDLKNVRFTNCFNWKKKWFHQMNGEKKKKYTEKDFELKFPTV